MHKKYFFELATGFWINISAAYFFAIFLSTNSQEQLRSLFYAVVCFGLAYLSRGLQK